MPASGKRRRETRASASEEAGAQSTLADWIAPDTHYLPNEFLGDRQFATTLARGLQVLQCFTPRDSQLSNAQLAARTGMGKPTISRFTYTLVLLGYLRINRVSGKYQLGSAVLSMSYPLLASLNIRQIARPFMKELADHVRGSVSLGMRDRLSVVYLESSRSAMSMIHPPDVGLSYPVTRTAMGRAFLSAYSREDRDALLNEIKVKTPGDWNRFHLRIEKSIQEYPERGFCTSYGDLRSEIHAVAVPMRPLADGEILVFNCGISAFLLKESQLTNDIGPRLVSMVRGIEATLGL